MLRLDLKKKRWFFIMKKNLGLLALGIMVLFVLFAEKTKAAEVANIQNIYYETVELHDGTIYEDNNLIQPRVGFRWRCHDCSHVGAWQISYNTAAKHALAHHERTSHNVFVYGV